MDNHFAVFGLEAVYTIDTQSLRQRYLGLQQHLHPDKHQGLTSDAASQKLNTAWNILQDPLLRAEHLLHLQGSAPATNPSPALLMTVMEQRETLAETKDSDTLATLLREQQQREQRYQTAIAEAFAASALPKAQDIALEWRYTRKFAEFIRQKIRQQA